MAVNRLPNQVYSRGVNRIEMAVRLSTVDMVKQAIAISGPDTQQLKVLLEALRSEAIPRSARQEMWERIAVKAQRSLKQSYSGRKFKRPVGPYRQADDRYSGALAKALGRDDMFLATPTGLFAFNREILDQEARHWRRLNFGAGQGGKERDLSAPRHFEVTGLGIMIGLDPDPRPSFRLPRGFWLGDGKRQFPSRERVGQDAFYVGTRSAALSSSIGGVDYEKATRGIAARNFLDRPIGVIAREIKPGIDDLWRTQRESQKRTEIIKRKTGRSRLPRSLF